MDRATLDLLEHLVTHSEVRHLLLIGAYRAATGLLYIQWALMGLAPLSPMLFLANFVARDLNAGVTVGALYWIAYGMGATFGPLVYGYCADRLGAILAVRWICFVQTVALFFLVGVNDLVSAAFLRHPRRLACRSFSI